MFGKQNLRYVKEQGKTNIYLPDVVDQFQRKEISRRDFMRMASALGMSAGAVYGFAGVVPVASAATPKKGGIFRIESPLQELKDPQNLSWSEGANVTRGICEYLTYYTDDAVVKGYLAENWKISDDGKTVDLFLRKGIKWSNGDDFNADDVVYNFARWRVEGNKSPNNGEWGSSVLSGVEKVNAHQVRLHLIQPDVTVAHRLFFFPTQIVHRSFDDSGADLTKSSIGTGPFTLDEYRVGESAKISRRNGYWGGPDGLGEAYLDGVHFISLGNDDQAKLSALQSGQIDWIYKISPKQLPVVQAIPNTTLVDIDTSQTATMRFNVQGVDPKIREAITLAADNNEILKIAFAGLGLPAENHHTCPIQPDYYDLGAKPKQDLAKAKQMWEAAGMTGKSFTITLGNTLGTWEQDAAQVLQQQCRKADIDLQLEVLPTGQYWEVWDKSDFGLTFWSHRPLAIMLHKLAYKSGVAWNESRFSSKRYDDALDAAAASADANAAQKHMKICQEELRDNFVMVQPFWLRLYSGGHDKVKNFPRHQQEYYPMHRIWMDA